MIPRRVTRRWTWLPPTARRHPGPCSGPTHWCRARSPAVLVDRRVDNGRFYVRKTDRRRRRSNHSFQSRDRTLDRHDLIGAGISWHEPDAGARLDAEPTSDLDRDGDLALTADRGLCHSPILPQRPLPYF